MQYLEYYEKSCVPYKGGDYLLQFEQTYLEISVLCDWQAA